MRDTHLPTIVSVRVVYLARLREAFGSSGETVEVTGDDAPSIDAIVTALRSRGGAFASELAPGRAVRFAVNHRLARREQAVADGDELALFPPVTGG
jgi:sulfur-carrier protein